MGSGSDGGAAAAAEARRAAEAETARLEAERELEKNEADTAEYQRKVQGAQMEEERIRKQRDLYRKSLLEEDEKVVGSNSLLGQ